MIIKSLSGKTPGFRNLYDYINRKSGVPYYVSRNLNLHDHADHETILELFENNSKHLSKRKNGNYLYHEIISIQRNETVPLPTQQSALFDVAIRYLEKRAKNLLAYGRLHVEEHHIHFHLMLSSNEINSRKRFRLSKAEFASIQKKMETYIQQTYPELEQKPVYTKTKSTARQTDKEVQYSKRTGKPSTKAILKEKLIQIFDQPLTRDELEEVIQKAGLTLYQRGKNWTVTDGKMKCRLKTLGLEENFYTMLRRAEEIERKREELASIVNLQRLKEQQGSHFSPQIRFM